MATELGLQRFVVWVGLVDILFAFGLFLGYVE